jgi:hypothetical protein
MIAAYNAADHEVHVLLKTVSAKTRSISVELLAGHSHELSEFTFKARSGDPAMHRSSGEVGRNPAVEPAPQLHISGGQVQLFQERGKSRVLVQTLQKGIHFDIYQTIIAGGISSVQPFERFVGLVAASVNLGYVRRLLIVRN